LPWRKKLPEDAGARQQKLHEAIQAIRKRSFCLVGFAVFAASLTFRFLPFSLSGLQNGLEFLHPTAAATSRLALMIASA
jgi:hypothetical protein